MSAFRFEGTTVSVQAVGPVSGRLAVPGSKSLTNRYLLLAALANSPTVLRRGLVSDDTRHMLKALSQLGVNSSCSESSWRLDPPARFQQPEQPLFAGNAGTVMRFLTPLLASLPFQTEIHGDERMALRPIADLVEALIRMGGQIDYLGRPGCPPLAFRKPIQSGRCSIRADVSSQYLSGLLMVLPTLDGPSELVLDGPAVSQTYIDMTLHCIRQFGLDWQRVDEQTYRTSGQLRYAGRELDVPADGSTASYPLALPLMVGGQMEVPFVDLGSHQGDYGLIGIFEKMGARVSFQGQTCRVESATLHGLEVDMNSMSDVAPTLAVVATRAQSPTTILGIGHMRHKECDRIETLQTAFDQLGLKMQSGPDWMRIEPGQIQKPALLDPQDDHRMAMVFALLGLADGGVSIQNANCVSKTYPNFYSDFSRLFELQGSC
ncbi:MAG: 3-phosphoshikimate 1-carboxyvinyltransferase [Acidobacteria bacterium]|nr:3-phosphoshikimate 1-carboxyvinyltransferase [Acidobacteriota bacterium]MCB9397583.1 3-phosphoshikimate 1-carboxyvinyltransferase [Acidobacteriota bacterium]